MSKWPKKVTVVEQNDMTALTFQKGQRCCAVGWRNKECTGESYESPEETMCEKWNDIYEKIARENLDIGCHSSVAAINDHKLNTNIERAALVNATWRRLGYNIPKKYCVGGRIKKI